MSWIVTQSRREIDPTNVRAKDIDFSDIAYALARTGRFGNHGDQFLSVARHSMDAAFVARDYYRASADTQLQCLLHDAAEAYIGDVVGPIKILLGEVIKEVENRFLVAIGAAAGIDLIEMDPLVKEIDMRLLHGERNVVFSNQYGKKWPHEDRYAALALTPVKQKPDHIAAQFLRQLDRLQAQRWEQ